MVNITWTSPCQLPMLIDYRHTIRPNMVFLKISSNMNLSQGLLDVLSQHVLGFGVSIRKFLSHFDQLFLHLLKIVECLVASQLH